MATSSTRPSLPMGVSASTAWRCDGSTVPEERIGGIKPGCTELTRMPSLAWRTAMALVNRRTAPLDAWYAGCPVSEPTSPMMDEMLTMAPPPVSSILSTAYLVPRKTPLALISMMRSQPSTLLTSGKERLLIPALLTSTSSLPKRSTTRCTPSCQSCSLVTSRRTNMASPPASAIWASICRPSASKMSAMATLAPSLANSLASAAPIPLAPPVIKATFPCNRIGHPPCAKLCLIGVFC